MRSLLLAALLLLPAAAEAVQATVSWTGDGASQARVERRDGADTNPFVAQGTVASGVASFNQDGLALATRYCYRVVQFNAFGDAPASPVACGTPDVPLPASGVTVIFAP